MDTPVTIFALILVAIVVTVAIVAFSRRRSVRPGQTINVRGTESVMVSASRRAELAKASTGQMQAAFKRVDSITPTERERLREIKDPGLVAQIDATIPVAAQSAGFARAAQAFGRATSSNIELLRADVPLSKLDKSREMAGAFRASVHEGGRIVKNANLSQVDLRDAVGEDVISAFKGAGGLGAAMGIASMVVGQYYMTQINDRLDTVEKGVDKIADFQDMEYKSRVLALVASVKKCSTFKYETLANDELRQRELIGLQNREAECAQLLGQANLQLQSYSQERDISFEDYERLVGEADRWFDYQTVLLEVMSEIAELTYTLNLGMMSRENSFALLEPYASQALGAREQLAAWHGDNMSKHQIEGDLSRRRKAGLEGALMSVPGFFNDDLNYHEIAPETQDRIARHRDSDTSLQPEESHDLYHEDTQIIKMDGKTYYLPPADAAS